MASRIPMDRSKRETASDGARVYRGIDRRYLLRITANSVSTASWSVVEVVSMTA